MQSHENISKLSQNQGNEEVSSRACKSLVTANYLNGQFVYRTCDHKAILFNQNGSVWRRVLPYCILNSIMTGIIVVCKRKDIYDLTFNDQGHSYMAILVSFLVVTRHSIAYKRYGEFATLLTSMMKSARELVQHTIAFTRKDVGLGARKLRFEIARQTIVMLRTVIFVLREEPDRENLYLNRTLKEREQQAIAISVGEANERTPNVLVIFLRSLIASHVKKLKKPLDVNEELLLLTNVTDYIGAYHQIMKLINSPFPFPLVQMTRTLLFIWLFSLPFALVNTMTTLLAPVIIMFFLTFGFQGLEFLSIIMDDPFGKDPIAFDVMTMGDIVYGDIYISLHDVDGQRVKERLQAVTSSTLSKEIKEEVHGHARSFSRMQSWIAVEKSGTSLESKTESEKGGEQGSISEKGVFFKTFSNDMQLSTISNSTIDSVDNAVIGKISYGSVGSSSFDHDREKKKIAKNSEGSMDVFNSSKSFKDEIIGSRYFEKDRNNRKVEFP